MSASYFQTHHPCPLCKKPVLGKIVQPWESQTGRGYWECEACGGWLPVSRGQSTLDGAR